MSGWWKGRKLPQSKPDGFSGSLWEGASGAPGHFAVQPRGEDDLECAALRGESFCLPSACKDAPLGQRQGGMFRLPLPYLWTPPTPQQVKGCTPLTILKQKSKHKKASAAPVGAIALTLFSLLHQNPSVAARQLPPGERARPPRFRRKRRGSCRFPPRPFLVKKMNGKIRRFSRSSNIKIIIPLSMRRATRSAF